MSLIERVTNEAPTMKDVYDAVTVLENKIEEGFPRKTEVKLWIAISLIGGQTLASLVTAYITHLSPPQQASTIASFIAHLL